MVSHIVFFYRVERGKGAVAVVIACLSMFVAFGALWFASEGLRRLDAQNEHLINSHIKSLRVTMAEYVKTVNTTSQRMQVLEKQVRAYRESHARAKETILALEKRTRGMRAADSGTDNGREVA